MQEDLAELFMRQMSMDGVHQAALTQPPTPSTHEPTQDAQPIVYSITQHYHHSSHIANSTSPSAQQAAGPNPEIPPGVPAESVLMQHNIDPWTLFPSQLELFKQAGPEQQSRLIALWQISPPGYSKQAGGQEPRGQGGNPFPSDRNGMIETGGDSMMVEDALEDSDNQQAEPYVVSGYESLAQRDYDLSSSRMQAGAQVSPEQHLLIPPPPVEPSTGSQYKRANDPAFQSREWWHHGPGTGQQQQQQQQEDPVEHQYGAFQQMNEYRDRGGIAQARGHWMEDERMF